MTQIEIQKTYNFVYHLLLKRVENKHIMLSENWENYSIKMNKSRGIKKTREN